MKPFIIIVSGLIWPFISISVYFIKLWSPVFGACSFFVTFFKYCFCDFIVGKGHKALVLVSDWAISSSPAPFSDASPLHASQNSVFITYSDKIFFYFLFYFLLLRILHNVFWLHLSWHFPKLLQYPTLYPPSFPTSCPFSVLKNNFLSPVCVAYIFMGPWTGVWLSTIPPCHLFVWFLCFVF